MKILAAIMDISFVKKDRKIKRYFISKVKRCLVYDPKIIKVASWDVERDEQRTEDE